MHAKCLKFSCLLLKNGCKHACFLHVLSAFLTRGQFNLIRHCFSFEYHLFWRLRPRKMTLSRPLASAFLKLTWRFFQNFMWITEFAFIHIRKFSLKMLEQMFFQTVYSILNSPRTTFWYREAKKYFVEAVKISIKKMSWFFETSKRQLVSLHKKYILFFSKLISWQKNFLTRLKSLSPEYHQLQKIYSSFFILLRCTLAQFKLNCLANKKLLVIT